ncbi:MAG: hypothetical protein HOU81_10255 [Hamadaea sp.]|uniref:hypothetical protein n=1 Tax=Hamadaea sp. TaxID=2024425 RepID=UPI0017CBD081|nr:hypothetical protein [Hamadaea sp.]NUR71192.1 hypothetical protein [Hamadaea sp.]NUT17723.1 hypothetical protein [Hamadaea sp.]
MSEDVLEFGTPRPAILRFAVPSAVPPILAVLSVAVFFGSLMYPWQTTRLTGTDEYMSLSGNDIIEYALTTGAGFAYLMGMMGLGAITATVVFGRRRHRRPLIVAGTGLAVMIVVVLVSLIALGGRAIAANYGLAGRATTETMVEVGLYLALAAPMIAGAALLLSLSTTRRRRIPAEPYYDEEGDAVADLTVTAA